MSMRHDLETTAASEWATYRVIPAERDDSDLAPVVLAVSQRASPFWMQDYLTPDQADDLAAALIAGAQRARDVASEAAFLKASM